MSAYNLLWTIILMNRNFKETKSYEKDLILKSFKSTIKKEITLHAAFYVINLILMKRVQLSYIWSLTQAIC